MDFKYVLAWVQRTFIENVIHYLDTTSILPNIMGYLWLLKLELWLFLGRNCMESSESWCSGCQFMWL